MRKEGTVDEKESLINISDIHPGFLRLNYWSCLFGNAVYELVNFPVGICFEVIGWCILFAVLTITSWAKSNKSAYQISLIFTTLIYTVVLDAVNLLLIDKTDNGGFVIPHLILLFVYCLVSIPMVIEGKR